MNRAETFINTNKLAPPFSQYGIELANIHSLNVPIQQFDWVARAIGQMGGMLDVTSEQLAQSYEMGLAQIALADGEIIAYVRLKELLASKSDLLTNSDISVFEVGSAMVDSQWRGGGVYSQIRNALYRNHLDRNPNSLILGTTVYPAVVRSIAHAREAGIDIRLCSHLDLPYIAALTCVCDSPEMRGCQVGLNACSSRITSTIARTVDHSLMLPVQNSTSPCVMHVSDYSLAYHINSLLEQQFTNTTNLICKLQTEQYYS